ncbi:circularly permuted type 2 ATP-grasp protein [Stieleria varia]|nr:circularly permuted type 2 ATP-grasp protein [Stieleria varia]
MTASDVNSSETGDLFRDYVPSRGVYDEYKMDSGEWRPHAKSLVASIRQMGAQEFGKRWKQTQSQIHRGDETRIETRRENELDPLPVILPSSEWQAVANGLRQRARLLNQVLMDVYGPQQLIKSGTLPSQMVFGHSSFLASCQGHLPERGNGNFLKFYAADLARSADGQWWVLADHTEAPTGMGYALENRIAISSMLPDVIQECGVQRLAGFFAEAREALKNTLPENHPRAGNPRVVMLNAGRKSHSYFEDAYMARYLGYEFVEPGDLSVRNGRVMLKTLKGLVDVDVILRHLFSESIDPLEFISNANAGVAGLFRAARSGRVEIANPLGSGLVESPAFMASMPQLCQSFLGEDLLLPAVATWWCGQPLALAYALRHLGELTLRRSSQHRVVHHADGFKPLTQNDLAELVLDNPADFAAQETIDGSTAPVWGARPYPGFVSYRAYLVYSGTSYVVMPGAWARTATVLGPNDASTAIGYRSKDVWIVNEEAPEPRITLIIPSQVGLLQRGGTEIPSRTADNVYWLGRQLERAEALSKLLRSTARRMTGGLRETSEIELPSLLRCLIQLGQLDPAYAIAEMAAELPPIEQTLPTVVFDPANPRSLRSILDGALEIESLIHENISLDTSRLIHRINEHLRLPHRHTPNVADLLATTDELVTELAALSGIFAASMPRSLVWRFYELGHRIEHSQQIISLIESISASPEDPASIMETMLEVTDSLAIYRSRYMARMHFDATLDLLLVDETNPSSLAFQFVQIVDHIEQLPGVLEQATFPLERKLAATLLHSVRIVDAREVAQHTNHEDRLAKLTTEWMDALRQLSDAITQKYLLYIGGVHSFHDVSEK